MVRENFETLVKMRIDDCIDTLLAKSEQYNIGADKLSNFKTAAKLQGCNMITALAGMMAKHIVSVFNLVQQAEQGYVAEDAIWEEKIGDSINYLLILSAMLEEYKEEREALANGNSL